MEDTPNGDMSLLSDIKALDRFVLGLGLSGNKHQGVETALSPPDDEEIKKLRVEILSRMASGKRKSKAESSEAQPAQS